MNRTRKWIGLTLAAIAFSTLTASAADWDMDVRGGWYVKEAKGPMVGVGGLVGLGSHWFANPNIEFAFGSDVDYLTVNGDFHYDFATSGNLSFWAGGGLAIVRTSPDAGDNETDLGLNALFGFGKKKGSVRPFGQAKLIISDETEFVLMGGIRF